MQGTGRSCIDQCGPHERLSLVGNPCGSYADLALSRSTQTKGFLGPVRFRETSTVFTQSETASYLPTLRCESCRYRFTLCQMMTFGAVSSPSAVGVFVQV